jgi:hypothetical protein
MFPLIPNERFGPDLRSRRWKHTGSAKYVNGNWINPTTSEKLSEFTGRKCLF